MLLAAACSGAPPVRVDPPAAAGPATRACRALHAALPDELVGAHRRDVTPRSALTAAWGDPPAVLRCGVARPAGLSATSAVIEVEGVGWFLTERPRAYVFTTVGRAPRVELRVPRSTPRDRATAPLVDLAPAVRRT